MQDLPRTVLENMMINRKGRHIPSTQSDAI